MNPFLEETIRKAEQSSEAFSRNITCKVYGIKEGALAVSSFTDSFHDIELSLLVDRKTFCIIEARAEMRQVPYEICRETLAGLEKLKGLMIYSRAVNRDVRRRIPRKKGCTHLFELIEFTLACLFSGAPMAGLRTSETPQTADGEDPEEHRRKQKANPWLRNTCLAFVNEGNTDNKDDAAQA